MYHTVAMAVIALAAVALPAETSLAFGSGAGAFGAPIASVAPAPSRVAPKPGGGPAAPGGPATPHAKKLSGKGGAACFRACMPGVFAAASGNSSAYSAY